MTKKITFITFNNQRILDNIFSGKNQLFFDKTLSFINNLS